MGKLSRDKGARWEREIAKDMTRETGQKYARVLTETRDGNSGDVRKVDEMGACMPVAAIYRTGRGGERMAVLGWDDFLEIASALPAYDFVIQAKAGKRPPIYEALKEAREAL